MQLTSGKHAYVLAFVLMADILNIPCVYQFFSLHLMNFIFHTMLDAAGHTLRVHFKWVKCDASFLQGAKLCYLGEVDIFSRMCKTFLPAVQKLFFF